MLANLISADNDNDRQSAEPDSPADEAVCNEIDAVLTELRVSDPLQEEWAKAVREHTLLSANDKNLDRILYMTGFTLLARARLLGAVAQIASDEKTISRHLPEVSDISVKNA